MLKRLIQAATITFLLNLVAYIGSPDSLKQAPVLPTQEASNLVASWR